MNEPKWYDQLAHGDTREDRVAARDNLHKRLETCGLDWSDAFSLAWYSESDPDSFEEYGE